MRLPSLLLLTGTSLVSAQWGEYLSRFLNPQKPLRVVGEADQHKIIEKRVLNITSENWRSAINHTATTKGEDTSNVVEEWFFYFTTSNVNGTRNATLWDGVFSETAIHFATSKKLADPTPNINLGKVDCASPESIELCNTFLLTSQAKLPEFYHIASYVNGSVELREVPWAAANITAGEEAAYLARFHEQGLWKDVNAWTGVFSPINGLLKEATPYLGMLIRYFDSVPSWVMMIAVSLIGRNIMSRLTGQMTPRVPPQPPSTGAS